MPDDETEELIVEQRELRRSEEAQARRAGLESEEDTHERRADKAAYLEDKLAERAKSEERVEDEV
jgi:hypothetical protein